MRNAADIRVGSRISVVHTLMMHQKRALHGLQKFRMRIPRVAAHKQEAAEAVIPARTEITDSDLAFIKGTSFVKSLLQHEEPDETIELPQIIQNVGKFLPLTSDQMLPYKVPRGTRSPLDVYTSKNVNVNVKDGKKVEAQKEEEEEENGRIPPSVFPRLSVTRLLTKSWCDLRELYKVYSLESEPQTEAMRRGQMSHLRLELDTHAPIDLDSMIEKVSMKPTKTDVYARTVIDTILKLRDLFIHGRAREIYVHGFVNRDGKLQTESFGSNESILVTGIIDHLFLGCSDPLNRPIERAVSEHLGDLKDLIEAGKILIQAHKGEYSLHVSDVKTRSRMSVPGQKSVVAASKMQVMIYRKFLETIGRNQDVGFGMLEAYCSKRNIDIDQPITPEFGLALLGCCDVFNQDFERLCNGEPIGVPSFDSMKPYQSYDWRYLRNLVKDEELVRVGSPFFRNWKTPLTTRYFLVRCSQLFEMAASLLLNPQQQEEDTQDLSVEYYFKDTCFETVTFKYEEAKVQELLDNAIKFWVGKRQPEPIERTYENINMYCRYCRFAQYCQWSIPGKT